MMNQPTNQQAIFKKRGWALFPDEIKTLLPELPGYRSKQIFQWMHQHLIKDFQEASNLPKELKLRLNEWIDLEPVRIVNRVVSQIDGTTKVLFAMRDGSIVEGVVLPYKYGKTFCISSQVGCGRGCVFCASTKQGLFRNLTAQEMVYMFYLMRQEHPTLKRVVFMGSGEPLDNLQEVLRTIRIWHEELGLHLSYRNITISTCGIAPKIEELADENLPITLTLSLHQAFQDKREQIMPVARTYDLHRLSQALDYYYKKTGRRISLEYTLIEGENSSFEDMRQLAQFIGSRDYHVNLIEYNPIKEASLEKTKRSEIKVCANTLEQLGIHTTIRREMGQDIQGSCGQLRNQFITEDRRINGQSNNG